MICGLLGRTLGHSFSPEIHHFLGDYEYRLFEEEPENLEKFLKETPFSGINVTIPYKKAVIPFCDELSDAARILGAVNTIVRTEDGRLIGHNTDCSGFACLLKKSGIRPAGKKCLVLGSGGASNTVCAVLRHFGGQVTVISRTGENNYQNLDRHSDAALIVNTTPVGMYPNTEEAPLSLDPFPHLEGVLDVIYNPARTVLLLQAEARKIPALNGLIMLVAQAKESAEWFTGKSIPDEKTETIYHALRKKTENVVLIGMPGAGKTTIGELLARKMHRRFIDTDEKIIKLTGKSIDQIFREGGESAFRHLETLMLREYANRTGVVLSTGGGCVTRKENYGFLHQNGQIFWIQRNLPDLPTDGRPLSQIQTPESLYAQRMPLYEAFADAAVCNQAAPEDCCREILEKWEELL